MKQSVKKIFDTSTDKREVKFDKVSQLQIKCYIEANEKRYLVAEIMSGKVEYKTSKLSDSVRQEIEKEAEQYV